jgi:hypothetical protein
LCLTPCTSLASAAGRGERGGWSGVVGCLLVVLLDQSGVFFRIPAVRVVTLESPERKTFVHKKQNRHLNKNTSQITLFTLHNPHCTLLHYTMQVEYYTLRTSHDTLHFLLHLG